MYDLTLNVRTYDQNEGTRWDASNQEFELLSTHAPILPLVNLDKIAKILAVESQKRSELPITHPVVSIRLNIVHWTSARNKWDTSRGTAEFSLQDLPLEALPSIGLDKLKTFLTAQAKADRDVKAAEDAAEQIRLAAEKAKNEEDIRNLEAELTATNHDQQTTMDVAEEVDQEE